MGERLMNLLRLIGMFVACFAFFALAASAVADEKTVDEDKIVGTWEVTKSAGGLPPQATVQFTKDGKLKISVTVQGLTKDNKKVNQTVTIEGTYKVEGDKLSIAMKQGAKENKETMTIKTLTDEKLVTVDPKGKEDEFKKQKK
jgi:uncharacterized protein (TIGR03066 family)